MKVLKLLVIIIIKGVYVKSYPYAKFKANINFSNINILYIVIINRTVHNTTKYLNIYPFI